MAQHPSVIPLLQASDAVERSDLSARTTLRSKPESPSNKFAAWNAAKAIWAFLLLARVARVLEKTWIGLFPRYARCKSTRKGYGAKMQK
jgi:hypothetical protein